jgi:hypothetical protein
LIASSSSCTLHRLVFCYRFLFPLFVLFVFLTFLPFLRRGARQECVRVVTLHARSPLSSFFLFLIQHTRAPLKRKEKEKKKKKRGGVGASPPTLQALFASLSDDVTKSFPHRDAKARHRRSSSFCSFVILLFFICSMGIYFR